MKNGIERIADERNRQRQRWTAAHDDTHVGGELAQNAAALCCGLPPGLRPHTGEPLDQWGLLEKHATNRLRQLAIAGALIVAEIERVERGILRKIENLTPKQLDALASPTGPITLSPEVSQPLVDRGLMWVLAQPAGEFPQCARTYLGLNAQAYVQEQRRRREQLLQEIEKEYGYGYETPT